MYQCSAHFYLFGHKNQLQKIIKEMPPLPHFSHVFAESDCLDAELIKDADVIIADLQDMDITDSLKLLSSHRKENAEVIICVDKQQTDILTENDLSGITDIWNLPLSEEEIRFRFLRWQQKYKMSKDFWQTRNYLDTTISSVPDLVWYKDKEGAHIKVNESFCKAVNKTMEQIEGRGHYYIWDIEPDEYAKGEYICMESEYEVMEKRETCVFDETVKIGDSLRQLKTYKSPLFDLDGSVMGTVGIASDVTQEQIYRQMIINNANTDFLTGLYNRRYMYQYIEQEGEKPLTVYYLDIDNFKSVNDKYGHQEGDKALVLTSDVLKKCMPDAMIARIGGDEFLIIQLGSFTEEDAEKTRKWLQGRLEEAYAQYNSLQVLSASIGTSRSGEGKAVLDLLIGEADAFMYREKNQKKQLKK